MVIDGHSYTDLLQKGASCARKNIKVQFEEKRHTRKCNRVKSGAQGDKNLKKSLMINGKKGAVILGQDSIKLSFQIGKSN